MLLLLPMVEELPAREKVTLSTIQKEDELSIATLFKSPVYKSLLMKPNDKLCGRPP